MCNNRYPKGDHGILHLGCRNSGPLQWYSKSSRCAIIDIQKEKWYSKSSRCAIIDIQKEITEYCISDVEILARSCLEFRRLLLESGNSCLEFRRLLLESGNVCPFTEATTSPSACNKIYRRNFLKAATIGIIPKGGYRWRDNQSIMAIQWLVWEEKQRGINIQHAAKGQEAVICGVKADGFCAETKQVFEFHGCFWHGCPRCIVAQRNLVTTTHQPQWMFEFHGCFWHGCPRCIVAQRNLVTTTHQPQWSGAKSERLRAAGYEVIEKWECQFRNEMMTDKINDYTENHEILRNAPLNPRDAFYGGTTKYYVTRPSTRVMHSTAVGQVLARCTTPSQRAKKLNMLMSARCIRGQISTENIPLVIQKFMWGENAKT
ncbi:hypothetical protein QE152_g40773 [Popillia japonica]|uniref:Uncharacterized protein n=1 Tax=Popillia japonica TaxID=7064 RepID=A0AAW1HF88_POPJA